MAIVFYAGSGSPYVWRAWLALEHKRLPYELRMLSFDAGDNKTPEYLAQNPRGRVPLLVDDGFALYESAAIVEYLEQAYPDAGAPLIPREPRGAAVVRRRVCEIDNYVQPPAERLVHAILYTDAAKRDPTEIGAAADAVAAEMAHWTPEGEWLGGAAISAADLALYPLLALVRRMETRFGGFAVMDRVPASVLAWMKRVEALPYYDATYPPHWRA